MAYLIGPFRGPLGARSRVCELTARIRRMTMMKAVVIYEAGGPEVLKVESPPIPCHSGKRSLRTKVVRTTQELSR
jgi:hypothetical protein